MAEQAQLFLLENRLKNIKSAKRWITISSFIIAFVLSFYWHDIGLDFFTGFVIWITVGFVVMFVSSYYFGKQEAEIIWQIQQIANGK